MVVPAAGHRVRLEDVDRGWAAALGPVAENIEAMREFLEREDAAGRGYLPANENVLRAFERQFDAVRVLIVGQDPYPTPGHSIGLAFAVERHVRPLPRSLANIHRELRDDLGIDSPAHGDLSAWSEQGVLLLNRVLTVRPGQPGSHRGRGWEEVTAAAVRALVARGGPLVVVLWGSHAKTLLPLLEGVAVLESAHPSPLSASRGFFGSRPFSRANESLVAQGAAPIDWQIPA